MKKELQQKSQKLIGKLPAIWVSPVMEEQINDQLVEMYI